MSARVRCRKKWSAEEENLTLFFRPFLNTSEGMNDHLGFKSND
ncbi:MAG: hypothetical protein WAL98_08905 [Desulfatiglandaceae bacterium]